MISYPKINQYVMVWYRQSNRHLPYHGQTGRVVLAGRGRPRNHLLKMQTGEMVSVPCGNLRAVQTIDTRPVIRGSEDTGKK